MYRNTNIISLLQKIQESVKEEVEEVPGTMKPQGDAEVETPDDVENIEKEDLDKLDVSKKKDRKDAVKELPDKELEIKPQERRKVKNGQLYLCSECCKTFESKKPICIFCGGREVELIVEGYKERGKRDGTGPFKGSAQRSIHGDKGRRKQAGEKCPKETEEGKIPADKDAEQTKINKLTETVEELIGEVPGISLNDQRLLHWAIKSDTIPNEFPDDEIIIDALSHLADVEGVEELKDVEFGDYKADIHGYYLKYVFLPRARKAYAKRYRESKLKEAEGKRLFQLHVETFLDNWLNKHGEKYQGLPRAEIMHMFEEDFRAVLYGQLGSKGIGESKLKEAENGYTTVAKGLEKDDADKLAAEKDGMVIEDSEDKTKFSVIVKEEE